MDAFYTQFCTDLPIQTYITSILYLLPSIYVYFSKRFYFPLGWETSCCIQSHFLTRGYLLIQFYRRYMHRLLKEVSKVHSKCYCIFQSNSKRHADTKVCGIGVFLKKKSYFHSKAPQQLNIFQKQSKDLKQQKAIYTKLALRCTT